uniref:Uncharacterized protein n=1 Tax=Malurus cyaneus samueli TaxID=2593467 RepID=A0A8C5UHS1_9PASS
PSVMPSHIAKKTRTPTSGPVITKLIFAKPINSKAVTGQTTQVSPVIAGRVFSQSAPGTPPKTITISESGVIGSSLSTTTQQTPNKIAISPLKSPNKVRTYLNNINRSALFNHCLLLL